VGIFGSAPIIQAASDSLGERYNGAAALHASAFSIFAEIADQLDEAAEGYEAVVAEATEEITRLTMIRDSAVESAAQARKSTEHVLSLTRGIPT
jgi:hypothetical protein